MNPSKREILDYLEQVEKEIEKIEGEKLITTLVSLGIETDEYFARMLAQYTMSGFKEKISAEELAKDFIDTIRGAVIDGMRDKMLVESLDDNSTKH